MFSIYTVILYPHVYYITVIFKIPLVAHWLRFSSLLNFCGWRNHQSSHSCDRGKFMPMKCLNVHADIHTCAGKDNVSPHEQILYSWWQEKLAGIFSNSSVWLYPHLYSMFYGYNYIIDAWQIVKYFLTWTFLESKLFLFFFATYCIHTHDILPSSA